MARLAAIYTRISVDSTGTQASTARQERLCRAWVAEQGWETVDVFEDIGRSAFNGSVRDAYEELLDAVTARRVDVVVCWRLDRLARSPGEFERCWSACQAAGVQIASATEPVDSTTPVGVALVRMLVTFAGLESDVRSIRLRARNREVAERGGRYPGRPQYGFTRDMEIIESEAVLVREAATRVLDGEGCTAIARSWSERGVISRSGGPWSHSGLRGMLQGRAICGDRTLHGEVVAEGCWPAIVDPVMAAQVRSRLAGSDAYAVRPGRPESLLRGLLRCGICNEKLSTRTKRGVSAFICYRAGCGRVSVKVDATEDWIAATVLARVAARRTGNRARWRRLEASEAVKSLDATSDALYELNKSYFMRGELTHPEWLRARDDLMLQNLERSARAAPQRRPRGFPPRVPIWRAAEVWDELTISARREVLLLELARVIVHPSPMRYGVWCSDRFEFVWVQPGPFDDVVPKAVRHRSTRLWDSVDGGPRRPSEAVPSAEALRQRGGPLRTVEACRLTGMSATAIGDARTAGHLHGEYINGMWLFHIHELDEWRLQAQCRTRSKRSLPEPLLDEARAAELLTISQDALNQLITDHKLVPSLDRADGRWFSQTTAPPRRKDHWQVPGSTLTSVSRTMCGDGQRRQ